MPENLLTDQLTYGASIPTQAASLLGNVTATAAPRYTVSTGLVATGTVIGDALQLTRLINIVATAAASTGVKLPPDVAIGQRVIVQNNGANTMNLFPPTSSGTLNGGSAGAALTIAAAAGNECIRLSTTDWLVSVFAKEN
jgi:hypothetical protein